MLAAQLLVPVLLLLAATARAQPPPGPVDAVQITGVDITGTGCAANATAVAFNPSRTSFTALFSDFIIAVGPAPPPTSTTTSRRPRSSRPTPEPTRGGGGGTGPTTRTCRLVVTASVPENAQFSLNAVDYRGFIQLDIGVVASISAIYGLASKGNAAGTRAAFAGPEQGHDFIFKDEFRNVESRVWSQCGGPDSISSDIVVTVDNQANPAGTGLITTDSADSAFTQVLTLQWRPCSRQDPAIPSTSPQRPSVTSTFQSLSTSSPISTAHRN